MIIEEFDKDEFEIDIYTKNTIVTISSHFFISLYFFFPIQLKWCHLYNPKSVNLINICINISIWIYVW